MPANDKRRTKKNQDLATVRTNLLALRGEAEMIVLRGARALELLCHGRYQNSLRFETPNAPRLIADNTALLTTLAGDLERKAAELEQAATYDGTTDEQLAMELTDHRERVPKLNQVVAKWRGELDR